MSHKVIYYFRLPLHPRPDVPSRVRLLRCCCSTPGAADDFSTIPMILIVTTALLFLLFSNPYLKVRSEPQSEGNL
jgi:hypothetical protein